MSGGGGVGMGGEINSFTYAIGRILRNCAASNFLMPFQNV
jgi:hypothetical protein